MKIWLKTSSVRLYVNKFTWLINKGTMYAMVYMYKFLTLNCYTSMHDIHCICIHVKYNKLNAFELNELGLFNHDNY